MKKLLLALVLTSSFSFSYAQCTPDPTLIPDAFGVSPDTIVNFPGAVLSAPYTTELHFKAPSDAGDIDPTFSGATITSFTVTSVTGIPPGMDYVCNIVSCQYSGGTTGCAVISGVCTVEGIYEIEINISAVINIPFLGNQTVPRTFTGYKIYVNEDGSVSVHDKQIEKLNLFPNPVSEKFTLTGLTADYGVNQISIFNMEGKLIQTVDYDNQSSIEVATTKLENGMYFVNILHDNGTEVLKFIKE